MKKSVWIPLALVGIMCFAFAPHELQGRCSPDICAAEISGVTIESSENAITVGFHWKICKTEPWALYRAKGAVYVTFYDDSSQVIDTKRRGWRGLEGQEEGNAYVPISIPEGAVSYSFLIYLECELWLSPDNSWRHHGDDTEVGGGEL
jgi:hypothetical protein